MLLQGLLLLRPRVLGDRLEKKWLSVKLKSFLHHRLFSVLRLLFLGIAIDTVQIRSQETQKRFPRVNKFQCSHFGIIAPLGNNTQITSHKPKHKHNTVAPLKQFKCISYYFNVK